MHSFVRSFIHHTTTTTTTTGRRGEAAPAGGPPHRQDHRQPPQPALRRESPSLVASPPPPVDPPHLTTPTTPQVFEKSGEEATDLRRALLEACPTGSAIVYCLAKKEAEALADVVQRRLGVPAAAYHAGMSELARRDVYTKWAR